MFTKFLPLAVSLLTLVACTSPTKETLSLAPVVSKVTQLESRIISHADAKAVLSAATRTLLDMGYEIERTEERAGLIYASKPVDILPSGQGNPELVLAFLSDKSMSIDKEQKIKASFSVQAETDQRNAVTARLDLQRITWNSAGEVTHVEHINDGSMYNGFFARLATTQSLAALSK